MKVMFFLFEGFDTSNGTNHLALTTIKELLSNGIDVYLLTSHTTGIYPDIPEPLKKYKGFSYSIIQRDVVQKKNFTQRYKDGIRYAINASKEWKKRANEIDVVLLQSTHTAWFSVLLMNIWLKKPMIYNSFDMFPDGPFLFGAIKNKYVYKVLSVLQNYIYKSSKKIVVISDDMKKTYLKKGIDKKKLVTIPNWYDSESVQISSEKENEFIKNYCIDKTKFIVQYAGNIGYTFNYKAFIEIAKLLKNDQNIQFHIIGNGGFEEAFKSEAKKNGLKNILFFPWQDSSIIFDVYSSCDIELIPLSKGVIWTSFPSKCSLLMACGRSFMCLCEKESRFFNFVNTHRIGFCIDRTNYRSAADLIRKLSKDKSELVEREKNGLIIGREYYSSEINAPKYVELIKKTAGERK